jgi:hypothetical protein
MIINYLLKSIYRTPYVNQTNSEISLVLFKENLISISIV